MPRITSDDFTEVKNAPTNAPVWLYRVATDDDPSHDLFLAESDQDVMYFKDANTPQLYQAAPIRHSGIGENTDSEIDTLKITWGNINREAQAYVEQRDGLRGKKVTIRQIFRELLGDPAACVQDIYTVDAVRMTVEAAEFTLTTKLDVLSVMVPIRKFNRHFCAWRYKCDGCWLTKYTPEGFPDGTFSEPEDFKVFGGGSDSCDKTLTDCERHNNHQRFGGFPGVPGKTVFTVS